MKNQTKLKITLALAILHLRNPPQNSPAGDEEAFKGLTLLSKSTIM